MDFAVTSVSKIHISELSTLLQQPDVYFWLIMYLCFVCLSEVSVYILLIGYE